MNEPNPNREEIRSEYESRSENTETYRNFGDANPDKHGGEWVAYDNGEWDYIRTIPSVEIWPDADEFRPGEQYVEVLNIYWDDIVTQDGEWTDQAQRVVDSLHGSHESPMGAVVDGRMDGFVACFASERAYQYDRDSPVQTAESYDELLDSLGVEPREE